MADPSTGPGAINETRTVQTSQEVRYRIISCLRARSCQAFGYLSYEMDCESLERRFGQIQESKDYQKLVIRLNASGAMQASKKNVRYYLDFAPIPHYPREES
jgi:hypothetical protein